MKIKVFSKTGLRSKVLVVNQKKVEQMKIKVFSKTGLRSKVLVVNQIATMENISNKFNRWEFV